MCSQLLTKIKIYTIGVGLPVINPIINNIPRMPSDSILTILATFGVGLITNIIDIIDPITAVIIIQTRNPF